MEKTTHYKSLVTGETFSKEEYVNHGFGENILWGKSKKKKRFTYKFIPLYNGYSKSNSRRYIINMNTKPIEHPIYRKSVKRTLKFIAGSLLALTFIMFLLPTLSVIFAWALTPIYDFIKELRTK